MVNGKSAFKVKMGIAMMGVVLMVLAGCGSVPREMASPNETVPLVQQAVDRYVLSYKSPPVKVRQNETNTPVIRSISGCSCRRCSCPLFPTMPMITADRIITSCSPRMRAGR